MKSRLIIIILLVFSLNSEAQVRRTTIRAFWQTVRNTIRGESSVPEKAFYVSSTYGNDSNPGTLAEPFQTLDKINSLALTDTSKVYLKRGDSFNGSLTVQSNSIIYDAYGTGDKPKIYGSDLITGWTLHSGSIYKATYSSADVTQLFLDDVRMQAARYPSTGYAKITTVNSTTQFISTDLPSAATDYYKNVKWIGRTNEWVSQLRTVTASTGNTLTINSAPSEGLGVNEGFILVGKLEFLTQPGQWFYDTSTGTLYLWTPNGDTPANYVIRGSVRDYGVFVPSGKGYITLNNLNILQQKISNIQLPVSNIPNIISNCTLENSEEYGILGANGKLTAINNTIRGQNAFGIYNSFTPSGSDAGSIITCNTVYDIALFDQLGLSGNGENVTGVYPSANIVGKGGKAIEIDAKNSLINYNTVYNIGYSGINFYGTDNIVEYNFVKDVCLVRDDGGGIYTWGSVSDQPTPGNNGSKIRYNIIDGSWGSNAGKSTAWLSAHGIYLDDNSGGIEITGNIVANCAMSGIFLHNSKLNTLTGNTLVNSDYGVYSSGDTGVNTVTGNTIYGMPVKINFGGAQKMISERLTSETHIYNNNTYVSHYNNDNIFFKTDSWSDLSADMYTFTEWKALTSQDASSTIDESTLAEGYTERVIYNNTSVPKTFYLNNSTDVKGVDGVTITGSFTLAAFTGKIITGQNLDCILDYSDAVAPVVESFTIPATSSSITIPISAFTVSGSPIKYLIKETDTTPLINDINWSTSIPLSFMFSSNGSKTLYAWVKDAAGNISTSESATTIISSTPTILGYDTIYSLRSTSISRRAMPVTFTENGAIQSVSFYSDAVTGNVIVGVYADESGAPGTRLGISAEASINSGSNSWNTVSLTTPVQVTNGTKVWLAFVSSAISVAYETGTPYRANASGTTYAEGLPVDFGTSSQNLYKQSIYCTYLK